MKLGEIGEEMLATAVKLAQERGASVEALHVIRVPMELPLDAELHDDEERAEASLAEAKLLGADHGVTVEGRTVRARSIGQAIVAGGPGSGGRPDRSRLGAALAAPVPLLLSDSGLRAQEGPERSADRRVPPGGPGRGRRLAPGLTAELG